MNRCQQSEEFLALQIVDPDADIMPCKIVDEMWHRHILDTAAYRADCEAIFGRFLDHFPYFGVRALIDWPWLSPRSGSRSELVG